MSDFSTIGPGVNGSIGPVNRVSAPSSPASGTTSRITLPVEHAAAGDPDRVELSSFARFLDQLRQLPAVRQDLVAQVRQAIDAGTYESEDKIDIALDRLASEDL